MSWLQTPRQIGATLKNAGRLRKIVSVLVKNGLQDAVQNLRLSSFTSSWTDTRETSHLSTAQRLRISFEELGPTFIKLGQLLASRPDLIPRDYVKELRLLQDQIPQMDFEAIEAVLSEQFPQGYDKVFAQIEPKAIGSASIAQVHRAILVDGTKVVIKVQKPGVKSVIEDDIRILHWVADLPENYWPELRVFNPKGMVNEFSRSMSLETNFVVEANNIARFQENFSNDDYVKIPQVFLEHSGPKILVMEELQGLPMSHAEAFDEPSINRDELMKVGLKSYFSMVFRDGFFHGDLHPGNIFILPNNKIGFIDFGMVGRLSKKSQTSIAAMFMALLSEDYDRLAYEYIEMAPFNVKTERQALAQDLRSILSPFFGLNLKDVNMGKLLLESSRVAAKHNVVLPSELMMFFKSMVTIEGLGRMIQDDFDLLPFIQGYAAEILKTKISTKELFSDVGFQFKEWSSLVDSLPKELKTHLRKINQADYANRVEVSGMRHLESTLFESGRLVFIGLVIMALTLSGTFALDMETGHMFYGFPLISTVMYALAATLFVRYFLKKS